jgi:hypothetical protein
MKKKLCPLRKSTMTSALTPSQETFEPCLGEECAWFDLSSRSCAIWLIAGVLSLKVEVEDA